MTRYNDNDTCRVKCPCPRLQHQGREGRRMMEGAMNEQGNQEVIAGSQIAPIPPKRGAL